MNESAERRHWWKIALVTVPAVVLAGWASGWLSNSGYSNAWFAGLDKPFFMPPGWLFGVVWPILYTMLGLALALVIAESASQSRKVGLVLFTAQLALNFAWSPLFFAAHAIKPALGVIVVMIALAAMAASQFRRIRPLAGALMLPYLAWLCFAGALNAAIDKLNPGSGISLPS